MVDILDQFRLAQCQLCQVLIGLVWVAIQWLMAWRDCLSCSFYAKGASRFLASWERAQRALISSSIGPGLGLGLVPMAYGMAISRVLLLLRRLAPMPGLVPGPGVLQDHL